MCMCRFGGVLCVGSAYAYMIYASLVVTIDEVYIRARCRCFHVSESTGSLSSHLAGPAWVRTFLCSCCRALVM